MYVADKDIEDKLRDIQTDAKQKRDKASPGSESKKYYRAITKELDKVLKTINNKNGKS